MRIVELGCAGHLIVASKCRWRRHTQVGDAYRVSTVGDYYPRGNERETIGAGLSDYYETMVFRTSASPEQDSDGCGCREVTSWEQVDSGRYATAGEAQAGHELMVQTWAARGEGR